MKSTIYFIFAFIVGLPTAFSQSPYHLNKKQEFAYLGLGAATFGLGAYLEKNTTAFSSSDLQNLSSNRIGELDLIAIDNFSTNAHKSSDWYLYGSFAAPLLFLSNKQMRKDAGIIATLWSEVILINTGLTTLSKYSFRRARPYVYNPEIPAEQKMTAVAQSSFISGHTSMTAANTFFAAKVFSDYFPNSKWKPVVWTAAATIPAITGYLRVKAGKHYPSDILAGYAVGAAIGYFVPHLHKIKGLSLQGGSNNIRLQYNF